MDVWVITYFPLESLKKYIKYSFICHPDLMIKMLYLINKYFFQLLAVCKAACVHMDAMFLRVCHPRDNVTIATFLHTAGSYVNCLTGHLQTWAEYIL